MKKYNPHIFAVSFLFVLGNSIITLPFFEFNFILHIVLSGALCLIFMFAVFLIVLFCNKFKLLYYIVLIAFALISVCAALSAFYDFGLFLKTEQLPQVNNFLLAVMLIVAVIPFVLSKDSAFYKYCLLCGVLCFLIIALGLICQIRHFNFSATLLNFKYNAFSITAFFNCFSHLLLLPVFVLQSSGQSYVKSAFLGTAFGFLLLLLCSVASVLTLGQSNNLLFPYIKSIGIISSGNLFTRIDGLFYFLFFVTSITKITVCIKTLLYVIKTSVKKASTL